MRLKPCRRHDRTARASALPSPGAQFPPRIHGVPDEAAFESRPRLRGGPRLRGWRLRGQEGAWRQQGRRPQGCDRDARPDRRPGARGGHDPAGRGDHGQVEDLGRREASLRGARRFRACRRRAAGDPAGSDARRIDGRPPAGGAAAAGRGQHQGPARPAGPAPQAGAGVAAGLRRRAAVLRRVQGPAADGAGAAAAHGEGQHQRRGVGRPPGEHHPLADRGLRARRRRWKWATR